MSESLNTFKFSWNQYWTILFILFVSFAFQLKYLGLHALHLDEGLYAGWALRVFERGDLFLNGAQGVDKPPLLFYLQAIGYALFGVSANTARVPSLLAGLGSVYLVYLIGKNYFSKLAGLSGAFLLAISPLHIAYSVSAFTDSLLVFWILFSLYFLGNKRFTAAGAAWGLALATKQFALLVLPALLLVILIQTQAWEKDKWAETWPAIKSFLKGLGWVVGSLLLISLFSNPPIGFLFKAVAVQKEILAKPQGLLTKTLIWMPLFKLFFQTMLVNITVLFFLVLALGIVVFKVMRNPGYIRTEEGKGILSLGLILIFYFGGLMKVNFRIYQRYLLPLLPFVCLLAGFAFSATLNLLRSWQLPRAFQNVFFIILVGLGMVLGLSAPRTLGLEYFEGAPQDGIESVAWYVAHGMGRAPVVFTRDFGWCYNFYCYGKIKQRFDFKDASGILGGLRQHSTDDCYVVWTGPGNEVWQRIAQVLPLEAKKVFEVHGREDQKILFTIFKLASRG